MRIAVVGTGYVGLVTGTCFAESGNNVTCIDVDEDKIRRLKQGEIPIYEPGLSELVLRNAAVGRLQFTVDLPSAVKDAEIIYLPSCLFEIIGNHFDAYFVQLAAGRHEYRGTPFCFRF